MVKGNWERRAELAATRRLQHKEEKLRPKPAVNGESVLTRLLRDELLLTSGATLWAWLETVPSLDVCRSWFKLEECDNRKCKLSHVADTLLKVRGIINDEGLDQMTIKQCTQPVLLQSLSQKDSLRIRYVALNGSCIFDFEHLEVWEKWCEERSIYLKQVEPVDTVLHVIPENEDVTENIRVLCVDNEHELSGDLSQQLTELNLNHTPFPIHTHITSNDHFVSSSCVAILSVVTTFLSNQEVLHLLSSGRILKRHLLEDIIIRRRYRECQSLIALNVSKQRKSDKKSKGKQANVRRNDKKDAFARGGNGIG
jgi:hypothetical protein